VGVTVSWVNLYLWPGECGAASAYDQFLLQSRRRRSMRAAAFNSAE